MTTSLFNSRGNIAPVSAQNTGSSGTLIAALPAGYLDLVYLSLTNEGSSATVVSITDGTLTYNFALAAYGGGIWDFGPVRPLEATTSDTAWTVSNAGDQTIDIVAIFQRAV